MKKRKLAKNTISSFVYQITTVVCGFIVPRLILSYYGSEVNGMINSISQFLQVITFLDLGVGAVVQSSLYKPLAEKNEDEISAIIKSADLFFKKLAKIFLVYVILLILFYPLYFHQLNNYFYTATLIFSMSISLFAEYYFGIVNRLLLLADQMGYIQYNVQTFTIILNTIVCSLLIYYGFSVQLVKLATSLIFMIRPMAYKGFVDKYYRINKSITFDKEPIKQKWNGIAQHVSAVVLNSTDTIILTIFSSLSDVSVYSVYYLVVYGVKRLFLSLTNGVQSLMGELWARNRITQLRTFFEWVEWSIHTAVVLIFGCTSVLIIPFIDIYTKGVTDTLYHQPIFAILLVLANGLHCIRLPYNLMILASGNYKETQNNYIISASLNIVISIALVKKFGLIGVALGTLIAMLYQTVWMAYYNSKNLLKIQFKSFIKQIVIDILAMFLIIFINYFYISEITTYKEWILKAVIVFFVSSILLVTINIIFYKEKLRKVLDIILERTSYRR